MTRLALALLVLAAGCGRFDHVGRPPPMTAPGEPLAETPPPTPQRIALATPRPAAPPAEARRPSSSLWRSGPASLFGDRRAQGRGDIVTVVVEINEEASISNATERSRTASEDLAAPALFSLPERAADKLGVGLDPAVEVTSASRSGGDGSVQRQEQITLRLAATVVDVLPNGQFVIAGQQEVRVNFELRDLRVQGVIRPQDISRANEITYDRIADARISYGGRGQITDVQQPRYGQQIADIILPF